MSAHVLLVLLNELGKRFYLFSPTRLINSIKHKHLYKILYVYICIIQDKRYTRSLDSIYHMTSRLGVK